VVVSWKSSSSATARSISLFKNTKVSSFFNLPKENISSPFWQDVLEPRSSIYHTALTLQNAFMHPGTTSDLFLRDNLQWLSMASNWSKFSATTALGVIHKGMTILGPYLPQANGDSQMQGAAYSEGGALYALGLINASCGSGRSVEGYL
jgi:26S proteasome regulatory subunit N2